MEISEDSVWRRRWRSVRIEITIDFYQGEGYGRFWEQCSGPPASPIGMDLRESMERKIIRNSKCGKFQGAFLHRWAAAAEEQLMWNKLGQERAFLRWENNSLFLCGWEQYSREGEIWWSRGECRVLEERSLHGQDKWVYKEQMRSLSG